MAALVAQHRDLLIGHGRESNQRRPLVRNDPKVRADRLLAAFLATRLFRRCMMGSARAKSSKQSCATHSVSNSRRTGTLQTSFFRAQGSQGPDGCDLGCDAAKSTCASSMIRMEVPLANPPTRTFTAALPDIGGRNAHVRTSGAYGTTSPASTTAAASVLEEGHVARCSTTSPSSRNLRSNKMRCRSLLFEDRGNLKTLKIKDPGSRLVN